MEGWIAIWKTYHRVCTRKKLIRDVFFHLSGADRFFAVSLAVLFITSGVLFVCSYVNHWDHGLWALGAMAASEIVILFKFDGFRDGWLGFQGVWRNAEGTRGDKSTRHAVLAAKKGLA